MIIKMMDKVVILFTENDIVFNKFKVYISIKEEVLTNMMDHLENKNVMYITCAV